jgi:shikimate dehydrogenase
MIRTDRQGRRATPERQGTDSMGARTKLVGIIGFPIGHSLSPRMQNAAFQSIGLDYCYIPLEVGSRRLRSAITALRSLKFRGFNVTIPHKRRIMAALDEVTPEALLIGAVNTVEIRHGRLIGHNTDGRGFLLALFEDVGTSVRGKRLMILGAGGAARAVAFQSALGGAASVLVANRSAGRAGELVRDLARPPARCSASALRWSEASLKSGAREADIIVNATSVGMKPGDHSPLPPDTVTPQHLVCDLIYRPAETALLQQARRAGAKTVNGIGMLVHQGALSFEIWTGKPAPISVMREALQSALTGGDGAPGGI